jgi:uncharacterized protein (TIGR03084 family)
MPPSYLPRMDWLDPGRRPGRGRQRHDPSRYDVIPDADARPIAAAVGLLRGIVVLAPGQGQDHSAARRTRQNLVNLVNLARFPRLQPTAAVEAGPDTGAGRGWAAGGDVMPADMAALVSALTAETAATRDLVGGLDEAGWRTPTPAAGWDIADQIGHLAYFDEAAVCSAVRPGEFQAKLAAAQAAGAIDPDAVAARFRDLSGAQMLAWFDAARAELLGTFAGLDPRARLPWFGPAMSAASALTARLMETWAHTQDIADALGVSREPTERLRHVAHIGVGARAFSYAVRGKTQPPDPVRVELTAPDGAMWTWGPADAADQVTGPVLDFCLLVTQRRHQDDLALTIHGPAATEWMAIAQAFAGAPGPGRPPATGQA